MNSAEKSFINKVCAVLIIIALTITDFLFVGKAFVSYAVNVSKTNSANVEFSAYFLDSNGEKQETLEKSIESEEYLYVDITVKNEGYFNGQITLNNSNFRLKKDILSTDISEITDNTAVLKQINAGSTATIKLAIEAIKNDVISSATLDTETKVVLTGKYVNSKNVENEKNIDITGNATVEMKWVSAENTEAILNAAVITNYTYNEEQIVQVLVESSITDNNYPVKNTEINITVPENVKSVKVHSRENNATNSNVNFGEKNYTYNETKKMLTINVANDNKNMISWNKNAKDAFVVTFTFEKDTVVKEDITANSTVVTYDNKTLTANKDVHIEEKIDGIVSFELINKEDSIYKGKIYTGQERDYTEINKVNIDFVDAVENISYTLNKSNFVADKTILNSNIIYKDAKINKQQFINLFGENGSITFKDGVKNTTIDASSQEDENGNISIGFLGDAKNIEVSMTKPLNTGVLTIEYTKTILKSSLNREAINSLTGINESIAGSYNDKEESNVTSIIELKNTSSKANLTVSTDTLSSTEVNKDVKITAVLLNNDESRDLYKNPVIKITFPKQVKEITIKKDILYANGLEENPNVKSYKDKENESYVLEIAIPGEQTEYYKEAIEGTTLIISANLTVDKLATNSNEKIALSYTNELATSYEDEGKQEVPVQIVTPNGLILTNNIPELEVEEIGNQGTKNVVLDTMEKSKDITIEMNAINNVGTTIKDVEIFGKIPTNGNLNLTLTNNVTVTGIENARVYYTQNEEATTDINNTSNAWQEESTGAKLFLIKVNELKAGEKINAKYGINIPENLKYNLSAQESYSVSYTNSLTEEKMTVDSTIFNFTTGVGAEIKTAVKATVGGEEIKNNDEVKAGEIIYYNITLKNEGNAVAENLKLETIIPENAILIELNSKYPGYDEEQQACTYTENYFTESNEKTKVENLNIQQGESKTISYMIRVNNNITERTNASIISNISLKEKQISKYESQFVFCPSNLGMIVRPLDKKTFEQTNNRDFSYSYMLELTNYTDQEIKNAKVYLNINDELEMIDVTILSQEEDFVTPEINEKDNSFIVDSVKPNELKYIEIQFAIDDNISAKKSDISAYVVDSQNIKYRSNVITEKVDKAESKVSIAVTETATTSSENNDKNIAIGDSLNYKISIKNTGKDDIEELKINDQFSDYINLEKITMDGKEIEYQKKPVFADNSNYSIVSVKTSLKANEEKTIDIQSKVDSNIPTEKNLEVVNKAEVYSDENLVGETEKIVHNIVLEAENPDEKEEEQEGNEEKEPGKDDPNEQGNGSEEPKDDNEGYSISGLAWFDENENGQRETSEAKLSNVKVKLIDINEGTAQDTVTSENGEYKFTALENGSYIAIFEFDTEKYALTTYKAQDIIESRNSDVANVMIKLNGEKVKVNSTDTLVINDKNIDNIDIGLVEAKVFDLKLDKTISKLTISNAEGIKVQEYNDATLAQKQIRAKYISGTTVAIEYKIKVTNEGEVAGYARQIVDYKSNDLSFNSELNPEWYQSGNNLYSTALANTKLEPGESKEIKLILTKKMTETNTGLTNNTAEISEDFNAMGIKDKDSTPGNKETNEDDLGSSNVIISVSTGAVKGYVTLTLSLIIVIAAIAYLISKKILKENINL